MARRPVVTIDGPAGAGKSTVSRALAAKLGFTYLDTGAIYRTVALAAAQRNELSKRLDSCVEVSELSAADQDEIGEIARNLEIRFADGGSRVWLGTDDVSDAIRTPEISERASRVSAIPAVRDALLELQRRLGREGGVVAEGRDVGTVVFPSADVKFFLTADTAQRAERRVKELAARGNVVDPEATRRSLEARDARDSSRSVAPLRRPDDAIEIDSGPLTPEQVVERMLSVVRSREGS